MSGYINVDAAIKAAKDALEAKRVILEQIAIVRTDLRHAVTMGATSPEQTKWIEEQFPLRERTTDPKERVAKAEQALAEAKAKVAPPLKAA